MDRFDYSRIPDHMMLALNHYARKGVPVGDFLRCVISNDLRGACERADDRNIEIIPVYVAYLYNEAPAGCWGSKERYERWIGNYKEV